jgi:hypothetical protein
MKTAKIVLWDELDHEDDFVIIPFHPRARETGVCQFQPKEPSMKLISVAPMKALLPQFLTVFCPKLHNP